MFGKIFLPLSMPGVFAAFVMVLVFSVGFFVTPAILGGGRVVMVAEAVFVQMFQTTNWGLGAAMSVALLLLIGVIVAVATDCLASEASSVEGVFMLGRSLVGGALVYLAAAFLLLPLVAVVPISFTPKRFLSLPDGEWSWRHYRTLVEDGAWLSSIGASVTIALAASLLATVLATMFGLGLWYRRPRTGALLVALALLPMVVPPVTSAIIIYFLLVKLGLLDTVPGLVIGHAIMTLPFAVVAMLSAFAKLDRSLEMAARNLGASIWQSVFLVVLPNVKAGILSAWFLTFILSWEESTVTLFTSGIDVVTLPKRVWDNLRLNVDPVVAAISVVMVIVRAAVIIARAVAKKRFSVAR